MSRRGRIVELWATLKYLGRSGVDEMVTGLHERAVQFGAELEAISGFTVLNEIASNQVLVKCQTDELTDRTLGRIQELRECWAFGSKWQGSKVIRINVCSWATTPEDIKRSAASFGRAVEAGGAAAQR